MLSESPAVGSVHGRAAQSRRGWTGSAAGPRCCGHPPASSARPDRGQGHGCCCHGPPCAPSPRGQSCSGLTRRTDVPAVPGWWIQRLRQGGDLPSSWRKLPEQRMEMERERNSTWDPGALPAPAQSWRLSVRCDSSFPTCLYFFSSSCVVPMIFFVLFLNSCSSSRGGGRIPVPCATQDVIVAARLPVRAAPAGSQEQRHKTLCFL